MVGIPSKALAGDRGNNDIMQAGGKERFTSIVASVSLGGRILAIDTTTRERAW